MHFLSKPELGLSRHAIEMCLSVKNFRLVDWNSWCRLSKNIKESVISVASNKPDKLIMKNIEAFDKSE